MTVAAASARGRWIPWAIVAFFGLVAAVNAVMIVLAVRTFPGLDAERPYELGLAYNRTLDAVARQAALGWTGTIAGRVVDGFEAEIALDLSGPDGAPLEGALVAAKLIRPVHQGEDLTLDLVETAPGAYRGRAVLPGVGNWECEVVVDRGEDRWAQRQRLDLR